MQITDEQKQKLKTLFASGGVPGSEMAFLNMDQFKNALGEDWAAYRDILFSLSKSVISDEISEEDMVLNTANGFAVLFLSEDTENASKLSEDIAAKITAAIHMNDEFKDSGLACQAQEIPAADFLSLLAADQKAPASETIAAEEAQAKFQAELKEKAKAKTKPKKKPVQAPADEGGPNIDFSKIFRELSFTEEFDPVILVNRDFCYRPLWSPRHQAIVASSFKRRRAFVETGNVLETHYYQSSDQTLAVDLTSLNKCVLDAVEMRKKNAVCQIMFPVNYNNISRSKYQRLYANVFRSIPEEMRKYLVPRLERISIGTPTSAISSAANAMRTYFERVSVEVPFQLENLDNFSFAKAFAIEMTPHQAGGNGPREVTERVLKTYVAKAKSLGSKIIFDGVDNKELLWSVVNVEADLISGPAIGGFSLAPKGATPMSMDKILNSPHQAA